LHLMTYTVNYWNRFINLHNNACLTY
jgi:hypothetical protein